MSTITSNLTDLPNVSIGSSLANITGIANQYVVAPIAAFGLAGLVFNAMGEATATLSADITDHYAEDNKAIQDQIAIRPKRVVLKGYVGELIYNGPSSGSGALATVPQKLTALTSFLPSLTASATQIQQAITPPSSASGNFPTTLGTASNIYALIKNVLGAFGPTQNQQNAYTFFKAMWQSKTLMGIQTPWEFMTNMAIESIVALQPENTQWMTDFAITLKEIRIAQTSSVPQSNASASTGAQGTTSTAQTSLPAVLEKTIAGAQQAVVTNLGLLTGISTNATLTPKLF